MAKAYILSKAASADFADIVRYTHQNWGEEQCRIYISELERATTLVAKGEGRFKDLSAIYPSLRMAKCGNHFIFCLPRPEAPPIILAILHEKMDILARLKGRLEKDLG